MKPFISIKQIMAPSYLWVTTNHFVYAIAADFICISAWHFCKLTHKLCVVSLKRSNLMDDPFKEEKFVLRFVPLLKGNHSQ